MPSWIAAYSFDLIQSVGIVASFSLSYLAFRENVRARRATNTFTVTAHLREIWSELYSHPELARVRDPNPDLQKLPITAKEEIFVP